LALPRFTSEEFYYSRHQGFPDVSNSGVLEGAALHAANSDITSNIRQKRKHAVGCQSDCDHCECLFPSHLTSLSPRLMDASMAKAVSRLRGY
jgi:hypothetical protein